MSLSLSVSGVHFRDHHSLLAGRERQLLIWIARRLPAWVTSDRLSALALVSMAAAGAAFAALPASPWAALGVVAALAANWFGDSLDGTVARVRRQERPRYGYYIDHVIDLAGTALLFGGIACSGAMTPTLALALLAAYLLVMSQSFLATHARAVFQMSFWGVGPTELRLVLAAGALKLLDTPWMPLGPFGAVRIFDIGGLIGGVGLTMVFVISAVRNARALAAMEPLHAQAPGDARS
ncbi:MAG: CDP-alcohol phosphatidyltransferase family protein [Acidobacteriota bacterium]